MWSTTKSGAAGGGRQRCASRAWGAIGLAWVLGVSASAHAGGIEYTGAGTVALGRGGAFAARADDPMALVYNPAALVDLADTQIMLNLNNAFYDSCVTRGPGPSSNDAVGYNPPGRYGIPGTYGANVPQRSAETVNFGDIADYQFIEFPKVCQSNKLNPGAWLAFAMRPTDDLALGFGLVTPAAAAHTVWGDGNGGIEYQGRTLPSPVRYQLIEQEVLGVQPTLGIAYRFTDWFSAGLSFQAGLLSIHFTNATVLTSTENPAEDNLSELEFTDLFVPALIGSLHFVPTHNMDFTLFGRWSDAISADDAKVTVEAKAFSENPLAVAVNNETSVSIPQPGHMGAGFRYADRVAPRSRGRGDPMRDERWDVELDLVYIFASQMDIISVDIPTLPRIAENGVQFDLPHYWKDQVSLRLGGDYNVIPDRLAVRAGVHYETSALDGSYTGIDFQPAQRFGLHAGLTYRVGRFDLSAAYAHIFQETIRVPWEEAGFPQVARDDHPPPVIVNAGTYETSWNILSVGLNVHL